MDKKDIYELQQFFSGVFHQDWDLDAKTPEEAISNYAKMSPKEWLLYLSKSLSGLITKYLEEYPDDNELENKLFQELGCCYVPDSVREWLRDVSKQLSGLGNKKS